MSRVLFKKKTPRFQEINQSFFVTHKKLQKLYNKLLNACDLILDDEQYFKLNENNVAISSFTVKRSISKS